MINYINIFDHIFRDHYQTNQYVLPITLIVAMPNNFAYQLMFAITVTNMDCNGNCHINTKS